MPNSGMLTYTDDGDAGKQSFLVKLIPGIEVSNKIITSTSAKNIIIEDFPGGVSGKFVVDGIKVSTEIIPLCEGREAGTIREGAALYKIKTEPKTPIVIGVGSRKKVSFLMGASAEVRNPNAVINNPLAPFIKGESKFSVNPGVGYVELSVDVPASRKTVPLFQRNEKIVLNLIILL